MKVVTKYAMLALLTTSFIALNNCGNQSGSASEPEYSVKENGPASDFAAILGAPLGGYPTPLIGAPFLAVEITCGNGVDDDGDGLVDCQDNDCHVHPECSEFGPPLEEIVNSRALTIYPNGILVPEDVAFLNPRAADDDDTNGWFRSRFFNTRPKDCWVVPREQDPYWNIPMGEAMIAGPYGPIGPQVFPESAVAYYGPRSGLINECEDRADLMFWRMDDDNFRGRRNHEDDHSDDGRGRRGRGR